MTCQKCSDPARYVVRSATSDDVLACRVHLADRVTYELGRAMRVDVRKVEVAQ